MRLGKEAEDAGEMATCVLEDIEPTEQTKRQPPQNENCSSSQSNAFVISKCVEHQKHSEQNNDYVIDQPPPPKELYAKGNIASKLPLIRSLTENDQ